MHFVQLGEEQEVAFGFTRWSCWGSEVFARLIDVAIHAGTTSEDNAIRDFHVISRTYSATHDDVVSYDGATGKANHAGKNRMLSYFAVMSNLYQVINLGSFAYGSGSHHGSIHCSVRTYFNMIVDFN
jgi:hypothetical protein